jgi:osmotically-inducible protein OsmY
MKQKLTILCLTLALSLPALLTVTGCSSGSRYKRSTGEYIDDRTLSSSVKSALHDNAEYKFGDVDVTTYRGTVQLNGFVDTSDQKGAAGDIASKVQGVKSVQNNISIKAANENKR